MLSILASALTLLFYVSVTVSATPPMILTVIVALLLFPPMTYSVEAMFAADLLGANTTQILLALAISLQVVKSVATGLLKLRVLPSRWSYVRTSSTRRTLRSISRWRAPPRRYSSNDVSH